MCLADFDSYLNVYQNMIKIYADEESWTKKSLLNIAGSGFFAADRSIREYAENIWHTREIKIPEKTPEIRIVKK